LGFFTDNDRPTTFSQLARIVYKRSLVKELMGKRA
jgi:hypothetical protein